VRYAQDLDLGLRLIVCWCLTEQVKLQLTNYYATVLSQATQQTEAGCPANAAKS